MLQTTVCNVGTQLTRRHDHVCERKLAIWRAQAWHATGTGTAGIPSAAQ